MKILVFSDIHGNSYAYKSLLESKDYKTADLRICLGDYIAMGPQSNKVLKRAILENCIMLLGNNDSYVINGLPQDEKENMPQDRQEHIKYIQEILNPIYGNFIKLLPYSYEYMVGDKKLYFTHYAWESATNVKDAEIVPTVEEIANTYSDIDADYIFYGHKHEPYNFFDGKKHYHGVGALGMRYPANYCIISIDEDENITVEQKQLDYDFYLMKQDMLDQNYVCVDKFLKFFE